MKRKVAAMYTHVALKDGTEGAVVVRQFDKTISDRVHYEIDTPEGDVIGVYEDDITSAEVWEEVEEDKITEY